MKLSDNSNKYIQLAIRTPLGKILSLREMHEESTIEDGNLFSLKLKYLGPEEDNLTSSSGRPTLNVYGTSYEYVISGEGAVDLSCHTSDSFEYIRERLLRLTHGKDGKGPMRHETLNRMSNDWVEACIIYNNENGNGFGLANELYSVELNYREKHGIFIPD